MPTPVTVLCPECGASLKLKSRTMLGKKRPCPQCKSTIVLSAAPDEDDFDLDARGVTTSRSRNAPAATASAPPESTPDSQTSPPSRRNIIPFVVLIAIAFTGVGFALALFVLPDSPAQNSPGPPTQGDEPAISEGSAAPNGSRGTSNESPADPARTGNATAATEGNTVVAESNVSSPVSADYSPDSATFDNEITPFLRTHCLKCHGPDAQESLFRVDEHLPNDFLSHAGTSRWHEVLNMLNTGAMPPEGDTLPDPAQSVRVIEWIEQELVRGERASNKGRVVIRRLNREEYNNTIRDLTGIDYRPGDDFPEDPPAGGFDNNGSALSLSPLQIELYAEAARKILDRAIVPEQQQPTSIKWRFHPGAMEKGGDFIDVDNRQVWVERGINQVADGMVKVPLDAWNRIVWFSTHDIPRDGRYTIRIRAAADVPTEEQAHEAAKAALAKHYQNEIDWHVKNGNETGAADSRRIHGWTQDGLAKHLATDNRYKYGPPRLLVKKTVGDLPSLVDEIDVTATLSEPQVYQFDAWFAKGHGNIKLTNGYHVPLHTYNREGRGIVDVFPFPMLHIDWIEIEGPNFDSWPPSTHKRIFIDSPDRNDEVVYAREVLATFMRRAYRGPVRDEDIDSKLALFQLVRADKPSFEEAMKTPLTAILASVNFLFLVEDEDSDLSPGSPVLPRFVDFLNRTKEADSTMLDNTMVLLGSGMNNRGGTDHSKENIPLLLVGGAGLGIKHDHHLKFETGGEQRFSNLLLTMVQKMGVETDTFSDSSGTLRGLI